MKLTKCLENASKNFQNCKGYKDIFQEALWAQKEKLKIKPMWAHHSETAGSL